VLSGLITLSQISIVTGGPGTSGPVIYDGPNNASVDDYLSRSGVTFRAEN
jgi:hypothetical protein